MGSRLCGGRPCSALDCETTNGSGSKIFCPGEKVMWAAMQQTIGCSLMRFFTDIERETLGVICPRVLAIGTSYQRFNRWAKSGVFDRIFKLLASDADNEYMMIDASIVRAHQHSAGARKKRPASDRPIARRTDDQDSCARRRFGQSCRTDAYARPRP